MTEKKAILFDLDGTILDSKKSVIEAVHYIAQKYKPNEFTYTDIEARFGEALDEFICLLDDKNKEIIFNDYMVYITENHDRSVALFPLVKESITFLKEKGYKLALTTNKQKSLTYKAMKLFEIEDVFDAIVCLEDVEKGKPDPEMLVLACEKLGVMKNEVLMVGDTELDVKAAQIAGIENVILDWYGSYHKKVNNVKPDYYFENIDTFTQTLFY